MIPVWICRSKAHIRRPSNASIGGGPTLITPQTRKQVLMSPNSDTSGKLNSGMYFDHAAQRWEGGDVDLSGFDVEDEAVPSSSSPRSKVQTILTACSARIDRSSIP
jgi:hypothetical protein